MGGGEDRSGEVGEGEGEGEGRWEVGEGRIGDGAVSTDDPAIASGHIYKKVDYIARGCTVWASLLHKKLT